MPGIPETLSANWRSFLHTSMDMFAWLWGPCLQTLIDQNCKNRFITQTLFLLAQIQIKWSSYTIQVPSALLRLDVTFNAALFLINFDRFCLLSLRCSWGIHGLRLKLNRPKLEIVDARTHWATSAVPQTLEGLSVGAPQAPIQLGGARSRAEWGFGFNLVERKFIQGITFNSPLCLGTNNS